VTPALAEVLGALRCPHCGGGLSPAGRALRCGGGHAFDLARQGYVNLTTGRRGPGTGDTAEMVAARERFLGAGWYDPLTAALGRAVPPGERLVVDVGGGTGHHLAAVVGDRPGLVLDLSVPALRRAARVHPRVAAAGVDAWAGLPLADGAAEVVLSVFAPRNLPEVRRCLAPGGLLVTVTPRPEHLGEAVAALGLIGVAPDKDERLAAALDGFATVARDDVTHRLDLPADAVADLVAMGPSARHVGPVDAGPMTVTAAVRVGVHRRE
jgi:23S rRNA (guanine745-N1)-methyltransferase